MNDLDFVLKAVNEKLHMLEALLDVQREQNEVLKEKLRHYETLEPKVPKEAM